MRKLLTLTAAAALVAALGFSGTAWAGLTDDLVGYWSFDDGVDPTADNSANSNTGALIGIGTKPTFDGVKLAPLVPNVNSLEFDGTGFVEVAGEATFDFERTDSFTIAAWVKLSAAEIPGPADGFIVAKMPNSGNFEGYVLLVCGGTTCPQGHILGSVQNNGNVAATRGSTNIADDTFHHVAMVWDGGCEATPDVSCMTLFVDGAAEALTTFQDNLGTNSILNNTPLTIGSRDGGGVPYEGNLDDVRVYDVALTADQIAALANPKLCAETVVAIGSIQDAVDANAGFVVCLSDSNGVFSQSVVFGPEDSGTTLRNVAGESPVMDGTGPADPGTSILADGIQLLDDVSDVTIKGLEIRDYTSTDRSSAIQAWDVDTTSINVRNNYMHGLTHNGVLVGSEGGFVHDSWMVKDNAVDDFGFVGIELTNCNSCSILKNTVDGTGGLLAIVVQARSTSTTGTGIHDVAIDGVSVLHNTVSGAFIGIYVLSFIGHPLLFTPITGKSVLLSSVSANNNTVTDNTIAGIRFWAFNDDATLRNGRIQHNVIDCINSANDTGVEVLERGDIASGQFGTVKNVKVVKNRIDSDCIPDIDNEGEATKLPPGGPFP